jgi:hypothetical protein
MAMILSVVALVVSLLVYTVMESRWRKLMAGKLVKSNQLNDGAVRASDQPSQHVRAQLALLVSKFSSLSGGRMDRSIAASELETIRLIVRAHPSLDSPDVRRTVEGLTRYLRDSDGGEESSRGDTRILPAAKANTSGDIEVRGSEFPGSGSLPVKSVKLEAVVAPNFPASLQSLLAERLVPRWDDRAPQTERDVEFFTLSVCQTLDQLLLNSYLRQSVRHVESYWNHAKEWRAFALQRTGEFEQVLDGAAGSDGEPLVIEKQDARNDLQRIPAIRSKNTGFVLPGRQLRVVAPFSGAIWWYGPQTGAKLLPSEVGRDAHAKIVRWLEDHAGHGTTDRDSRGRVELLHRFAGVILDLRASSLRRKAQRGLLSSGEIEGWRLFMESFEELLARHDLRIGSAQEITNRPDKLRAALRTTWLVASDKPPHRAVWIRSPIMRKSSGEIVIGDQATSEIAIPAPCRYPWQELIARLANALHSDPGAINKLDRAWEAMADAQDAGSFADTDPAAKERVVNDYWVPIQDLLDKIPEHEAYSTLVKESVAWLQWKLVDPDECGQDALDTKTISSRNRPALLVLQTGRVLAHARLRGTPVYQQADADRSTSGQPSSQSGHGGSQQQDASIGLQNQDVAESSTGSSASRYTQTGGAGSHQATVGSLASESPSLREFDSRRIAPFADCFRYLMNKGCSQQDLRRLNERISSVEDVIRKSSGLIDWSKQGSELEAAWSDLHRCADRLLGRTPQYMLEWRELVTHAAYQLQLEISESPGAMKSGVMTPDKPHYPPLTQQGMTVVYGDYL